MGTSAHIVSAYIEQQLPGVSNAGDLKLCKLVYYTQAWHLAWEGSPLFSDRIEAWKHGPVAPRSYFLRKAGVTAATETLTPDQRSVIDAVLSFYGRMSGPALRQLTHDEPPWQDARGDLPESAHSSEEITVASMRRYYTRKAMAGDKVPSRARHAPVAPSVAETLAAAERELPRWSGTMARLAHR